MKKLKIITMLSKHNGYIFIIPTISTSNNDWLHSMKKGNPLFFTKHISNWIFLSWFNYTIGIDLMILL